MSKALYYEDFAIGQQIHSEGTHTVEKDDIIAFARQYDPQSQHIDEEGAKTSLFGTLVASGWHTAAMTMRLKTRSILFDVKDGLVGIGIESIRWPRPTLPGDTLRLVVTILDKRTSKSRPDKGIVKYKAETLNQRGELAMEMITAVIVPRREPGE